MTKKTKGALLASAISLLLCIAMLVGSTFAWFTDSATTGVNTITAGNLDIALYKGTVSDAGIAYETAEVDSNTKLFKENALYEPGYTEVAYLKIANLGNLAVKYKLTVAFSNEVAGTNMEGDPFKLSEVLRYSVLEIDATTYYANREAAQTAIADTQSTLSGQAMEGFLPAQNDTKYYAIVIYMPEETDNKANYKTGTTPPSVDIGVSLVATQYTSESDSFDNQYDVEASYPTVPEETKVDKETFTVVTADQLYTALEAATSNTTGTVIINIENDFVLAEGETWAGFEPSVGGTNITINGNNHKIVGLNAPLMGASWGAYGRITFNDLTLENANIVSDGQSGLGVGAFCYSSNASGGLTFNNCHLVNSVVTANQDYAGGFVGYSNGALNEFINCSVTGSTVTGLTGSTGAFFGQVGTEATAVLTITGAKVQNTTVVGEREDKTGLIGGSLNDGQITVTCDATLFTGNKVGNATTAAADNNSTAFGRYVKNFDSNFTLNGKAYTAGQKVITFA